jgi:hypothetical protein
MTGSTSSATSTWSPSCSAACAINARPSGSTARPSANPGADLAPRARDVTAGRRRGHHPVKEAGDIAAEHREHERDQLGAAGRGSADERGEAGPRRVRGLRHRRAGLRGERDTSGLVVARDPVRIARLPARAGGDWVAPARRPANASFRHFSSRTIYRTPSGYWQGNEPEQTQFVAVARSSAEWHIVTQSGLSQAGAREGSAAHIFSRISRRRNKAIGCYSSLRNVVIA